jgi:membrane dipeptidase
LIFKNQTQAVKYLIFLLSLSVITSCKTSKKAVLPTGIDQALMLRAQTLSKEFIITDGHVDLPYRLRVKNFRLEKEYMGIPIETSEGDFDYKRAKEGGLDAPFMSIYLPASLQKEKGASKALADSLITMIEYIGMYHPTKFGVAYNPQMVEKFFKEGKISLPMGMENGSGIEDDLANIGHFKRRGISYITLTHSKDNLICDSSYDTTGTWKGLSPYGIKVVEEMNKEGVMVDISHVSDSTYYQVLRLTNAPVIASHSSCRKFTPGFERNMSDEMLVALAKNDGVIQINFGSSFLDSKVQDYNNERRDKLNELLAEKGLSLQRSDETSEEAKKLIEQFSKDNPKLFSDVEMVVNHIDNVVQVAGINHVGLGSDFDGVGDSLPTGLKDVSKYPNVIYEMLKRGYSEEDIEKVCYKNVFRVWNKVIEVSENMNKQ